MNLEESLCREELVIATFSKRVYAYVIDELIMLLLTIALFYNQFSNVGQNLIKFLKLITFFFLSFFVLKTIYHTISIHFYGKTIGKIVAKIRIVDIYLFDNPSLKQSLIRALLRNFDELFFYLGMAYALANPFKQTLHDKISKVVVIDE